MSKIRVQSLVFFFVFPQGDSYIQIVPAITQLQMFPSLISNLDVSSVQPHSQLPNCFSNSMSINSSIKYIWSQAYHGLSTTVCLNLIFLLKIPYFLQTTQSQTLWISQQTHTYPVYYHIMANHPIQHLLSVFTSIVL